MLNHSQPMPIYATEEMSQQRSSFSRWTRLLLIVLFALLTAGVASVLLASFVWTGLPIDEPAPLFRGTALDGEEIDLGYYHDQPVMLTFWSPTCSACLEELPVLQALVNDPTTKMKLITVVSHTPTAEVEQFVREQGLTFTVLADPSGTIAERYAIQGVPFTYFIDQNGYIEQAVMGAGNQGELESRLSAWLHGCQVDAACTVE